MTDPTVKRCWFCPTPGWLILALLVVECLLWLSERFQWFAFNEHKGWTVLIAVAVVGVAAVLMLLWFAASLVFRWRFQFSIRSLLVLVVVVAVPCSWLAVEMKAGRKQQEMVAEIRKAQPSVFRFSSAQVAVAYDYEVDAERHPLPNPQPPGPAWLRSLLGDDFFAKVVSVDLEGTTVTDAKLESLKRMTKLRFLNLRPKNVTDLGLERLNVRGLRQLQVLLIDYTQITDRSLEHLKGLSQLRELRLDGTKITDAGLENLAGLKQLETLYLNDTTLTDAGLAHLKGLSHLHDLEVCDTRITDAGLEHLKGLSQLQEVNVNFTNVTDEGVKKLRQALPNCQIYHEYHTRSELPNIPMGAGFF